MPIHTQTQAMSFIYGDEWINFDREPRPHARSRVLIKVHPDCRVVVSAPEEADDLAVLTAVKSEDAGFTSSFEISANSLSILRHGSISAARAIITLANNTC